MTRNALQNIEQIESSLWETTDQLRANSKVTSSEYGMPVLGVIFCAMPPTVTKPPEPPSRLTRPPARFPSAPLVKAGFVKRRAMMLPKEAQFDDLLKLPVAEWSYPWSWDDA